MRNTLKKEGMVYKTPTYYLYTDIYLSKCQGSLPGSKVTLSSAATAPVNDYSAIKTLGPVDFQLYYLTLIDSCYNTWATVETADKKVLSKMLLTEKYVVSICKI